MTEEIKRRVNTHIAVEERTQKQVAILSKIFKRHMYVLVAEWADQVWNGALSGGLVTDAMLQLQETVDPDIEIEVSP